MARTKEELINTILLLHHKFKPVCIKAGTVEHKYDKLIKKIHKRNDLNFLEALLATMNDIRIKCEEIHTFRNTWFLTDEILENYDLMMPDETKHLPECKILARMNRELPYLIYRFLNTHKKDYAYRVKEPFAQNYPDDQIRPQGHKATDAD